MLFHKLNKYRDAGLLILRIGIGILFIRHGYVKLSGGPETWTGLGHALSALGIGFAPNLWVYWRPYLNSWVAYCLS